jgi:hypothetical protein
MMTTFHFVVLSLVWITVLSEAIHGYLLGRWYTDALHWEHENLQEVRWMYHRQIMLTAANLAFAAVLIMVDDAIVAFSVPIVLPMFMYSFCRWREQFEKLCWALV